MGIEICRCCFTILLLVNLDSAVFKKKVDKCPLKPYYVNRSMTMKDIVLLLVIVGVWYLLQAHILPKLGIST